MAWPAPKRCPGTERVTPEAPDPPDPPRTAPPPLTPFGLRLHHDGRWTHEGMPLLNRKLRAAFDRSVRYLPDEAKYVVQLRHFRGEIDVEEALRKLE